MATLDALEQADHLLDLASDSELGDALRVADDGVEKQINQRGYQAIILHSDYREMEKEQWPEIKAEIIIVDSYYVKPSYFSGLHQKTDFLVYIDDLNAFPYFVDLVIYLTFFLFYHFLNVVLQFPIL